jgi:hypothetical protein
MPPILSFSNTFDTTVALGDKAIPIHVSRITKSELEELDANWMRLVQMPRGTAALPPGVSPEDKAAVEQAERDRLEKWNAETAKERFEFFAIAIERYVTVSAGIIEDCGRPVTKGEDLVRLFHGLRGFLRDLVGAVITENHLAPVVRKNLKSPRASEPGSEASIPARGGDGQGPIAASAATSAIAPSGTATALKDETDAADPRSSGRESGPDTEKVH